MQSQQGEETAHFLRNGQEQCGWSREQEREYSMDNEFRGIMGD